MSRSFDSALWSYGFRPFFLVAALAAPLLVLCWLIALLGGHRLSVYFDPLTWHAHEMLFGFAGAMIAGFLLTAVPNWTKSPAVHGVPLGLLCGLWVLGRSLFLLSDSLLVTVVDLAFMPALAALILPPLWRARDPKRLVFSFILLAFWCANALTHLQVIARKPGLANVGLHIALGLTILLIVIIGGRVIPFFTERALSEHSHQQRRWRVVEITSILSAVLLPVMDFLPIPLVVAVCSIAALAHGVRLGGWYLPGVWSTPLLWVLYIGYAWVAIGFALKSAAALGSVPASAATHAFTAGAMGIVGLGIMARASLGHTGRALEPSRITVASFIFVTTAAALRVGGPLFNLPMRPVLIGAGWLWVLAFLGFLVVYLPILTKPRADA